MPSTCGSSLFYPPGERPHRGKTTAGEDVVNVRFTHLAPPHRVEEAVTFDTADPALSGEMTIVVTLEKVSGGTNVTFLCTNLPPGLKAEDNDAGARASLEQLARLLERQRG